jgi:hypothetical protein
MSPRDQALLMGLGAWYKVRASAPIEAPTDHEPELRSAVGVSSETDFINGTRLVVVTGCDRGLRRKRRLFFYPGRLVPREGHAIMWEREIVRNDLTPRRIVECLREALRRGEPSADLNA